MWAAHLRCFSSDHGEAAFDRLQLLLEVDEAEFAAFCREEEDMEAWDSDEEDEEEEEEEERFEEKEWGEEEERTESAEVYEEDTKDSEEDDDILENDSASVHYK